LINRVKKEEIMCSQKYLKGQLLKLVEYEHEILRQVMGPVSFPLSDVDLQYIRDMKYSIQSKQLKMANAPWEHAAGMAANQWGIQRRIFLYCPEADTINGLEVVINPSYEPLSDSIATVPAENLMWESCFSVPLATGQVIRYNKIRAKYQNEKGEEITKELSGYKARVWQHENDHLNGYLYDDSRAKKCLKKMVFSSLKEVNDFFENLKE
jgi:peptide deformylase